MSHFWSYYWDNYLERDAVTEEDLFKQVAQTVNRQPITCEQLHRMCDNIVAKLQLAPEDHLLEFCCGNGLFSYELAAHVGCLTGVDFAPRLIRTAQQWKTRPNTVYVFGDATAPLSNVIDKNIFPNKFLMNCSLAYLETAQLDTILTNILDHLGRRSFVFLATSIPNCDLRWDFYDTPERRARHRENEKQAANINDGIGRWWRADEIQEIGRRHGLTVWIENQRPDISHYRMDALHLVDSQPLMKKAGDSSASGTLQVILEY